MAGKTPGKRKPAAKGVEAKQSAPRAAKPAKAPVAPAEGLRIALLKEGRLLPGCGFGIDQPVLLGAIDLALPAGFDFAAIEPMLEEFAIEVPAKPAKTAGASPEGALVERIHAWQAAIQRGASVPVFGGCRLSDGGLQPNGLRRISFAMPSVARPASIAAMQFVIGAIVALAPAPDNADILPAVRKRFAALRQILSRHAQRGINPLHFLEAAHELGIEHALWAEQVWMFGLGRRRLLLNSTVTSATPHIGVSTAKDKLKCSSVLHAAGLPVAQNAWVRTTDAAAKAAQQIGYPVVIKPANLDQGIGVTAGIENEAELRKAFAAAAKSSQRVMIEKHHYGRDYRVTVLHGKVIKVMDRRPGGVTGDGTHTVARLVELSNERDLAMRAKLGRQRAPMVIDEEAAKLLAAGGYEANSVIPAGEFVALRRRANISAGGTYEIIPPDALHPDNRALAINATAAVGLDLAGIDVISADPAKSWRETGGIIVEVNAQPQIGYRDTESIFGEILLTLMQGKGEIPVHLAIVQDGFALPAPLPKLAAQVKCNAAAWGTNGWIAGAGPLGPFANAFRAARGVLLDTRTAAALIAMTEQEVLRFGLPAAKFASIRFVGEPGWQPPAALQQLVGQHGGRGPQVKRPELVPAGSG